MNLIGILNWFDEQPAWLSATVASMARAGVNRLVAIDGAYMCYPDAIRYPRSGPEQYAAIYEVCQAMQIGCTIHSPTEVWLGNEVEKRSFGFALAELYAEDGDWYVLMDADQVITNAGRLHAALKETDLDVAGALFYERGVDQEMNGMRALWPVRCIFRAIPGLRVVDRHYSYVLPDGRDLWGEPPYEPSAVTLMEVEHRTRMRSPLRKQAQEAYYRRRDETGAERAPRVEA